MASPPREVPTAQATKVLYCPTACSYVSAMTIPTRLVAMLVAMMAPLIVASACRSWNQMPGSIWGYEDLGAVVGAWWG